MNLERGVGEICGNFLQQRWKWDCRLIKQRRKGSGDFTVAIWRSDKSSCNSGESRHFLSFGGIKSTKSQRTHSYVWVKLQYCPWHFPGRNVGVGCHFLLQWTMFCQNSSLWTIHLGWPRTAWLIASLTYTNPFTITKLWHAAVHGVTKSQTVLSDWTTKLQ